MSIINEALKKTQDLLQASKESPAKETPENNKWLWLVTILVIAGFVGCAFAFLFLIKTSRRDVSLPVTNVSSDISPLNPVPSASKPAAGSPQTPSNNSPLVLNGIIASDKGNMALINNQIYKEGDEVEGKKVLSIKQDKVEIFDKGEIITLTTK